MLTILSTAPSAIVKRDLADLTAIAITSNDPDLNNTLLIQIPKRSGDAKWIHEASELGEHGEGPEGTVKLMGCLQVVKFLKALYTLC
jgi:hypothetical protein